MELILFLKGLLAGLAVAAPVGPIGTLCIQRTLSKGKEYGLFSFLGAATADALYGFAVISGLVYIQAFLVNHQTWLELLGGLFLFILGFRTFFSHPHVKGHPVNGIGLLRAYTSSFFLAIISPSTLIWMIVVLLTLRVAQTDGDVIHSACLMSGIFLGSASWWLVLAGSMGLLGVKRDRNVLLWIYRVGGVMLVGFGFWIFLKMIFKI
jgi:threonine/homoserine/homoserine lactone efflux protein